jgi:hypothetical protein
MLVLSVLVCKATSSGVVLGTAQRGNPRFFDPRSLLAWVCWMLSGVHFLRHEQDLESVQEPAGDREDADCANAAGSRIKESERPVVHDRGRGEWAEQTVALQPVQKLQVGVQ